MTAPAINLRPIELGDEAFLRQVYASTRAEELAQVPWSPEDKRRFIDWQFQSQHSYYRDNYPGASFHIIVLDGVAAGRLYLHRREREIRIIDIALLPGHRRKKVGSTLLRELMAEARASGSLLSLHLESLNPARTLYERLGFKKAGENGIYELLEWRPDSSPSGLPEASPTTADQNESQQ